MTRRVGIAYHLSTWQRNQRHVQSMKGNSWFQDSTSESDKSRRKDKVKQITRNMECMYSTIKKDKLLKRTAKERRIPFLWEGNMKNTYYTCWCLESSASSRIVLLKMCMFEVLLPLLMKLFDIRMPVWIGLFLHWMGFSILAFDALLGPNKQADRQQLFPQKVLNVIALKKDQIKWCVNNLSTFLCSSSALP